jgi:hypothetical protein
VRGRVHRLGYRSVSEHFGVGIKAPYGLSLERQRTVRLDVLAPGEEREISFMASAVAALSSGSLHVANANGGG